MNQNHHRCQCIGHYRMLPEAISLQYSVMGSTSQQSAVWVTKQIPQKEIARKITERHSRLEVNNERRIGTVRSRRPRRRRRIRRGGQSQTENPERAGRMVSPAWREQLLRQPYQGQTALLQQLRHDHHRHHPSMTLPPFSLCSENSEDNKINLDGEFIYKRPNS